jgi:GMP synthase (glutamine-hydrolysing)
MNRFTCLPSLFHAGREGKCLKAIRDQVGETNKVLMLLSGGVDSTVCAALITKAIGQERVMAIHIDNGFMRKNESEQVSFDGNFR